MTSKQSPPRYTVLTQEEREMQRNKWRAANRRRKRG